VASSVSNYKPWYIASTATLLMGLLMLLLDKAWPGGGEFWRDWITEHSTLIYFCEPANVKDLFRQKVDTYTNLAFFFFAILTFAFAKQDQAIYSGGFGRVHHQWANWYATAMLMTFLGSSIFHASLTRSGEALDLAGTYAAAILPGFFNLHRLFSLVLGRRLPTWPFVTAWLAIWLICSLLIFRLSSRVVVPGSLLLIGITGFILFLKIRPRQGWGYAAASILLTVLAATFFVMDIQKVGCNPSGYYQAHGMWHLLAGCAAAS
jgi:hypothetical protein